MSAQEVRSRPVGFVTQTIGAGQTRTFSMPFDPDLSNQANVVGRLTGVGSNYLENTDAAWTPGAFSNAAAPYFVRIASGSQVGRIFVVATTANTATRIFVLDDGLGLASLGLETGANGARFEIIPGDTLATFFGSGGVNDPVVLQGGADASTADLVLVWGGAGWLTFYYNTTWQRWARNNDTVASPTRNTFQLRPDRGLMITRRGSTPLTLSVTGRVLTTPQRAVHLRSANASTFLASMQATNITIGALGLQLASRSTGWVGSSDPAAADLLLVWSGAAWFSFYFNNTTGHWQRIGSTSTNLDAFVIPAGTPIFVQRRAAATSVDDKTIAFPTPGS